MSLLLHFIVTYIKENIITTLQKLYSPPRSPRAGNKLPTLFVEKTSLQGWFIARAQNIHGKACIAELLNLAGYTGSTKNVLRTAILLDTPWRLHLENSRSQILLNIGRNFDFIPEVILRLNTCLCIWSFTLKILSSSGVTLLLSLLKSEKQFCFTTFVSSVWEMLYPYFLYPYTWRYSFT